MSMALQVASASFCRFHHRNIKKIQATAAEDFAVLTSEVEKVKLGRSDLKVTKLGIGAWSWGDTTFWNDFQWDGMYLHQRDFHIYINACIDMIWQYDGRSYEL